jgi:hypothetical protein
MRVVRSPVAHAVLGAVDVGDALKLSGVRTVLTGADISCHRFRCESAPTPVTFLLTCGEATVWAGWALFYASPAVWAGLVTVSAAFATIVPWEERRLLEHFGEDYRAYLADMPRWVPRAPRRPRPADQRRFRADRDRNHQAGQRRKSITVDQDPTYR